MTLLPPLKCALRVVSALPRLRPCRHAAVLRTRIGQSRPPPQSPPRWWPGGVSSRSVNRHSGVGRGRDLEEMAGGKEGRRVPVPEGGCILSRQGDFSALTFSLFNVRNTETCPNQIGPKGLQSGESEITPGPPSALSRLQPAVNADLDAFAGGRTEPQRWWRSKEGSRIGGVNPV